MITDPLLKASGNVMQRVFPGAQNGRWTERVSNWCLHVSLIPYVKDLSQEDFIMLQTLESRSNGVGDWDPIYYRCLWIALTTADSWIGCFGPFFYQVLGGFSSEICISSDPCSIGKFAPIAVQPTVPLEFLQPSTLVQTDGYDELKSKRNPTSVSKKSSLSYQQCQV